LLEPALQAFSLGNARKAWSMLSLAIEARLRDTNNHGEKENHAENENPRQDENYQKTKTNQQEEACASC
jgi:hypothetical protein